MKTYQKHQIIPDLIMKWLDKQLLEQDVVDVVSFSKHYIYMGNTLSFPDFGNILGNAEGDMVRLKYLSELFNVEGDLSNPAFHTTWKEKLFSDWLLEMEDQLYRQECNGAVSYGIIEEFLH